jgi:N-acetylneuraminic acid mutarotase
LLALVLFTAGGCLVVKAALFRPEATNTFFQKALTFADRVAYQHAIEEVYWQHRIWPNDNPGRKPPLDAVASRQAIEHKVEDYLRKSQLVADQRGGPINGDELQAELERIAAHTKQPAVLRELFAALGNDPFVIAECLARPILAERLLTGRLGGSSPQSLDGKSNCEVIKNSRPSAIDTIAYETADPPHIAYMLPEIPATNDCTDDTWTATSTVNTPSGEARHTAVWTGSEMIVWGGWDGFNDEVNTGGRYNPSTDSWTATSTFAAPVARAHHTAVWTGTEMIVWGGFHGNQIYNNGGRYNPSADSWVATTTINAPDVRESHTAVWTGSEMIVWGGEEFPGIMFNTGGRYNPATDSWTVTTTLNAPAARAHHTAVWTGSEMIVWGNSNNTGGRYNPSTNNWVATTTTNAPSGRSDLTAVWTGSEMIIWGGQGGTNIFLNTGGRYNPGTNSWVPTSVANAPNGRAEHTAVWTGSEMIIWGGNASTYLNTGGRYNPGTNSWVPTSVANAPDARELHTAVWTGGEMIVWGGSGNNGPCCDYFNTGGRYCAQPSAPIVQSAVSQKTHGSTGTFAVPLPLPGTPGIECRSGGATNDYTIAVTFLANVSVNGSPQAAVTAGSGTVGSAGMSNGGMVTISDNVVTIPLTNIANAQTINVTLFDVNGSTNVLIPMSILIGDTTGNGTVNASDVSQTKSRIGQATDQTNFRSDVNTNGNINAADVSIVKSSLGTGLP